jgi:hypothetical protein
MSILKAIRREEKKLDIQVKKLQHQLSRIRAAAKALGRVGAATVKKRVMSAAGRANISKATKKRWAKFRAQAKKAAA